MCFMMEHQTTSTRTSKKRKYNNGKRRLMRMLERNKRGRIVLYKVMDSNKRSPVLDFQWHPGRSHVSSRASNNVSGHEYKNGSIDRGFHAYGRREAAVDACREGQIIHKVTVRPENIVAINCDWTGLPYHVVFTKGFMYRHRNYKKPEYRQPYYGSSFYYY